MSNTQQLKSEFIKFLIESGALTFGDFTTKAGRKSPYFINTGNFNTGTAICQLGKFYAQQIELHNLGNCDIIFGPAYKGIPLAVTTAVAMETEFKKSIGVTFNRKEAKDHGDKGMLVGAPIKPGARIVIVEDVLSAGTTLREIVPYLRSLGTVEIAGVVVSADRAERGLGKLTAIQESQDLLKINIYPIVSVFDILEYLETGGLAAHNIDASMPDKIKAYLKQYGAQA